MEEPEKNYENRENEEASDMPLIQTRSHCPYLGLLSDADTSAMFPKIDHACHRVSPAKLITLEYQGERCLNASFVECPGFEYGWKKGFPRKLSGVKPKKTKETRPMIWLVWAFAGVLLTLLVLAAAFELLNPEIPPTSTLQAAVSASTATQAVQMTNTPTVPTAIITTGTTAVALTPSSTIEPSPTSTFTPTVYLTQTPGPQFGAPLGTGEIVLAIHQVQPSEVYEIIAGYYDTNSAVLEAINQLNPPNRTALWENDLVVVCVGCKDSKGLPKLTVVYARSNSSIADISMTYNTSIEELRAWNGLGDGDLIEKQRWMIVRAN